MMTAFFSFLVMVGGILLVFALVMDLLNEVKDED